jgi:hypothetical protein
MIAPWIALPLRSPNDVEYQMTLWNIDLEGLDQELVAAPKAHEFLMNHYTIQARGLIYYIEYFLSEAVYSKHVS